MSDVVVEPNASTSTPPVSVQLATPGDWSALADAASPGARAAAILAGFKGLAGELVSVPSSDGVLQQVLFGLGDAPPAPGAFRGLSARLPPGDYRIVPPPSWRPAGSRDALDAVALGWALGTYRFDRYKREHAKPGPRLFAPGGVDVRRVTAIARACALTRDMVNTPANDMGPMQIETVARDLARTHGAAVSVVVGDDLLEAGYPAVHAVGRAAVPHRSPRMIELTWGETGVEAGGEAGRPLVAVVGKGVVFDTGGLDMKPSAAMRLMKKDMGGAAHSLGLASMIMALNLPVRLVVLIPAVENAISGDAMRPGDVLASRKGLTIEVGNTDAEGRLILADALTRAGELSPDLTIDLATLTGAARAALGPQVIPFYTADEALAAALTLASAQADDPLWRMPLWAPYESALDSDIADLRNDPDGWAQAGSVTAALFLKRFAPLGAWVHFDIFAWNPKGRPGWPVGGEAQAIRAMLAVLEARYR